MFVSHSNHVSPFAVFRIRVRMVDRSDLAWGFRNDGCDVTRVIVRCHRSCLQKAAIFWVFIQTSECRQDQRKIIKSSVQLTASNDSHHFWISKTKLTRLIVFQSPRSSINGFNRVYNYHSVKELIKLEKKYSSFCFMTKWFLIRSTNTLLTIVLLEYLYFDLSIEAPAKVFFTLFHFF